MKFERVVAELVGEFGARRPLRAGSVIVTIFGDVIVPRGGQVWLGSVIRLLGPLGLSERLVRTSASRLAADRWLLAVPKGRRSDYRLTPEGARRFAAATRRIYAVGRGEWDGQWHLVFVNDSDLSARKTLRAELGWLGFAPLATGVYAHPSPDHQELSDLFADQGILAPLQMRAHALPTLAAKPLQDLVAKQWNLSALSSQYAHFTGRYETLARALKSSKVDGQSAFHARTLMIHDYRRLLLRDPDLPREVLGSEWAGDKARSLVRSLYSVLSEPADAWLADRLESHGGPLAGPNEDYYLRFTPPSNHRTRIAF